MDTLLLIHGHNRWLVAIVWSALLVALGWARLGWSESAFRVCWGLLLILLGLLAVQLLIGGVLFVWKWQHSGSIPHYRWEHVVLMLGALSVLHLPLRWRRLPLPARWRRTLWSVLLAGGLLFLGVARLPKGWLG